MTPSTEVRILVPEPITREIKRNKMTQNIEDVKIDKDQFPPYTFLLYQEQAMRTAKHIDESSDVLHAALGLSSEAGEVATTIKKWLAYGQPLDVNNIVEELGDILWFIALMCKTLGIDMDDIAVSNIAKLYARYPDAFSDMAAMERADKQGTVQ